MSVPRFVEPPPPKAGESWCLICLMMAKQMQCDLAEAELAKMRSNGRDDEKWIEWPRAAPLRPAAYQAVSDVHALGVVGVCWDHVAGLSVGTPLAPGLLRPRGRGTG